MTVMTLEGGETPANTGWPRVRFVSAPHPQGKVRFDFNSDTDGRVNPLSTPAAPTSVLLESWSIGVPQTTGDPDGIGVEYGLRQLTFSAEIEGSHAAALAAQSRLAREVQKRRNWLLFQLDKDAAPVWFRTYRSQPGALDFAEVYVDQDAGDTGQSVWKVGVTLDADPHALGETRVESMVTVSNDPATTGGCVLSLPTLLGDAATPARVRVTPVGVDVDSAGAGMNGSRWLVATYAHEADRRPIVFQPGDTGSFPANSTAARVTSSAYSGGAGVAFPVTTPGTAVRATSAATSVPVGQWRVLARVVREDASTVGTVRADARVSGSTRAAQSRTVTVSAPLNTETGWATWVDLDVVAIPVGIDSTIEKYAAVTPSTVPVVLDVVGARTSGTGRLVVDAIMLVPVDDVDMVDVTSLVTVFDAAGPHPDGVTVFDGDEESTHRTNASGSAAFLDAAPGPHLGAFPMLHPAAPNVMVLLQQLLEGPAPFTVPAANDAIAASTKVTISYQPRWLWVGDGLGSGR